METRIKLPEWWEVQKFAYDPIFLKEDDWYFLDETWSSPTGPFNTKEEAIFILGKYCEKLNQEFIDSKRAQ